jgi:AraC-like DNA-binding protein
MDGAGRRLRRRRDPPGLPHPPRRAADPRRRRRALRLDDVAREVGLSRPHFYKLFRAQIGLTPTLYLNALRMEHAIERLAGSQEAVSDIGFDLGFSSQASFSRFFISNGVVPPSTYRRSVHQPDALIWLRPAACFPDRRRNDQTVGYAVRAALRARLFTGPANCEEHYGRIT